MEPVELFSGAVRFNPLILCINLVLIVQFFSSWYFSAKESGWIIEPFHVGLFFSYFLSFLLQYPFSSSIGNWGAVGGKIYDIQKTIDWAYYVSLVGYFSLFAGAFIFKKVKYQSAINLIFIKPIKNTIGILYKNVVGSLLLSRILFFIYFLGLALILLVALKAGRVNDPRSVFYEDDKIRAVYNFITIISGVLSIVLIGRIFQFNKLWDKIYFALFIVGTLFIGARGYIVGPLLTFFTFMVYFNFKGRVKLKYLLIFGVSMLTLILTITFFRAGRNSGNNGSFLTQIFYGNSFSDLRDFAWVLSAWNGESLHGNTYLAGLMSFIPSAYSDFRSEWAIGRVTAILGGFNPKEHPGLRPGTFGEAYLNFGIAGVVILGIVLGYYARYIDYKIKYYSYTNNRLEAITASLSGLLIANLPITSGFFSIYTTFLILLFLFCLKVFFRIGYN